MIDAKCGRCRNPLEPEGQAVIVNVVQQPARIHPTVGAIAAGQQTGQPIALVCPTCINLLVKELRDFVVREPAEAEEAEMETVA